MSEKLNITNEAPDSIMEFLRQNDALPCSGCNFVHTHCRCKTPAGVVKAVSVTDKLETLFDAIKHGDEGHQEWLKEAIRCHFNELPMPEYNPGKPKQKAPTLDEMIDAAEKQARFYDNDDRECIKTDVMNSFYAGIRYTLKHMGMDKEVPTST